MKFCFVCKTPILRARDVPENSTDSHCSDLYANSDPSAPLFSECDRPLKKSTSTFFYTDLYSVVFKTV